MDRDRVKKSIFALIGIFFMFCFAFVCPTWATVTRMGVQYLGVMIGWIIMCAAGLPMVTNSIMAMAACIIPGFFTTTTAITSSVGTPFCVLIVFIFVLVHVFEKSGTGEYLVRWFLSRKIVNGRPYLFTAIFLFAIMLIGSIIGSFGALMITITILNNIATVTGLEKQDDWIRFLLLSVVATSGVTEILYPFKPYAQLYCSIFNASLESIGTKVSDGTYFATSVTIAVLSYIVLMILARFVFHFDLRKVKELDVSTLQAGEFKKMKKNQVIILIAVIISFFHPFITMLLPKGSNVFFFMDTLGQSMFMGVIISLLALIHVDGKPILEPVSAFAEGVNWHVVFGMGMVLLVGGALASDKCGISKWLLEMFQGSLVHMGIVPITIVVALLSCFITQFFSNSATAIILCSALGPISVPLYQSGINVSVFPAVIGLGTFAACLLPSGSGQSAIMLGTEIFEGGSGQAWAFTKGMIILVALTFATALAGAICITVL